MDAFKIQGGVLRGEVQVPGSKNGSLPITAAALLSSGNSVLQGVPELADVRAFTQVLKRMGVRTKRAGDAPELDASFIAQYEAPHELVRTMSASILNAWPFSGELRFCQGVAAWWLRHRGQ